MTVIASDGFGRTSTSGLGTADLGGTYSTASFGGTVTATDWSVNGSAAKLSIPASGAYRLAYLAGISVSDVYVAADFSIPALPTGAPIEIANLMLRGTTSTSDYLARTQVEVDGRVTIRLFAPGGTLLATGTAALTYTAGLRLRFAALIVGTTFRAKVWAPDLGDEPLPWTLITSAATSTTAGFVGFRAGVASGNTNTKPIVVTVDNFVATTPLLAPFPSDPLDATIELALDADLDNPDSWVYTDITADWQSSADLAVTIGRAAGTTTSQTGSLTFTLRNPDGRYTLENPGSPYAPFIRENTPVRVTFDAGTGGVEQYTMYATTWTPRWPGDSRHLAVVDVVCNGVDQRLSTSPVLRSPLYRALIGRSELRAYWPMEDGSDSTAIASALATGAPMSVTGGLSFAADSSEPGSAPLPVLTGTSQLIGMVSGSFANQYQVDWYYKIADPMPNEVEILRAWTTGTAGSGGRCWWSISVGGVNPDVMTVRLFDAAGTKLIDDPGTLDSMFFGQWVHARIMAQQSGSNIAWQVVIFPLVGDGSFSGGSIAGTVGGVWAVTVPQQTNVAGMAMGHAAVLDAFNLGAADFAQNGYAGELATDRMVRLCGEHGVPITIVGTSDTKMGPQGVDTLSGLLQTVQAAELGELVDGLSPGYTYMTRSSAYNLTPSLVVDMATNRVKAPFQPLHSTQGRTNDVTVSRQGGSSARYVDEDGPLGTRAVGVWDGGSVTLNLASDDVLPSQAGWRVHQGTVPGYRYPTLAFDLHLLKNAPLTRQWLATGLRSRALLQNPAAQLEAQDDIDLLIEGYTQTIHNRRKWSVTANCSPYRVWEVWKVGDSRLGRLGAGNRCTLHQAYSAGATSLLVDTSTGPLWITTATRPTKFPFDVGIGGWQITVTGVSGTSSPQTFTVDPIPGDLKAGAPVGMWKPGVIAL